MAATSILVPRLCLGTHCLGGSASRGGTSGTVRSQAEPGNEKVLGSSDGTSGIYFPESGEMLGEQSFQPCCMNLLGLLKHQAQHVAVGAMAANARRHSERFDLAEIEMPLLAKKAAVEPDALLAPPLRPGATDSRH